MVSVLGPNEELDIALLVRTNENQHTLLRRDKQLTISTDSCPDYTLCVGQWVAIKMTKGSSAPDHVLPIADRLQTTVKEGVLYVDCRCAMPDADAYGYGLAPLKFVWSPEFEWIHDPRSLVSFRRGCRADILYDVTVRKTDSTTVPGFPNLCHFEVVEVHRESDSDQIDVTSSPWYRFAAEKDGQSVSSTGLQYRSDPLKCNENQIYVGVVRKSRKSFSRQGHHDVWVWGRETGEKYVFSHNPVLSEGYDVGQWVKYKMKKWNDQTQARLIGINSHDLRPARAVHEEGHTETVTAEVQCIIRVPEKGAKAMDEKLGAVYIASVRRLLDNEGYSYQEAVNRRIVCWARMVKRGEDCQWEVYSLADDVFEDEYETNGDDNQDLIQF